METIVYIIIGFFLLKMMMKTKFDINSSDAKEILEKNPKTVIIDVRTRGEYSSGHMKGAKILSLGSPELRSFLEQADKKSTYILYCASGARSGSICKSMASQGFEKVYNLSGGVSSWRRAGYDLVR